MRDRAMRLAAVAAIGGSYLAVRSARAQVLDRRAGAQLSRPLGPVADRAISAGTDLGSVYAIAGLGAVLAVTGRREAAADVVGAGAVGWVVAQGMKPLVKRPRPYQAEGVARLVVEPAGASWPSGHVAVASAMATALGSRLPAGGKAVATLLSGLVAHSRIYVGVHYVTDIVAGLGVGAASAAIWRAARRGWLRVVRSRWNATR